MNELAQIFMNDTVCRMEDKFLISQLGDEMVLMDIQEGHYINVNPVGSFIWNKIVAPLAVKDLIFLLTEEYDIPTVQCEAETLKFLQKMQQHNMLHVRRYDYAD
jgi:hypothetical protein